MRAKFQRPKGRDRLLSTLNVAIEALNLTKELSSATPAHAVIGAIAVLLTMMKDSRANKTDYVELGLACADIYRALDRGMEGRGTDQLSGSVLEAIEQLTTTVAAIQRNVKELGKRNLVSRLFHAKNDKETVAAWKLDLNRILHVFNTELAVNAHAVALDTQEMVSDIHRTVVGDSKDQSTRTSVLGELPPPRPRACFGRDDLIEKVICLVESLTPFALVGTGGIGKTSIALVVLHDDRVKKRFGNNRRFIRCDQFPASRAHFLARLSKIIGADIENPTDLAPLRPFLSSQKMIIILDNAESILDPQGANAKDIYQVLEELSQFDNICLAITSRITIVPPNCKTIKIPTLPTKAAHDAFYNIYEYGRRSDSTNAILKQLDFHPLSVTLLATVAHQNDWDNQRLADEWEERQTYILQTEHQTSLATTIELSIASPMFKALGPNARGLLEVIAFYPQGVSEKNLEWLFPTISNTARIFDKFCNLSLTYRSNGFITMLAPLRDYLRPKDPTSPPLLRVTKEQYFARMSVKLDTNDPGFKDTEWVITEDVNIEYLLDVFTSINPDSDDIWNTCINFIDHLQFHKPQPTILKPKIEGLPDDHRLKPECLATLGMMSGSGGNHTDLVYLLNRALELFRERKDDKQAASTLSNLANTNRILGRYEEGMGQAREALEIYERLDEPVEHAWCLDFFARLLLRVGQLDAAEEASLHAIRLLPERGQELLVCRSHHTLGLIYRPKEERDKAVHHFKVSLGIASPFGWPEAMFWINLALADLFLAEDGFDDAHDHIQQAKSYTFGHPYRLGHGTFLQARIWYRQDKFEDATYEARHALEIFEKLGVPEQERCKTLLQEIERTSDVHGTLTDSR